MTHDAEIMLASLKPPAIVVATWRSAPERQPTSPPVWRVHVHETLSDGTTRTRIEDYRDRGGAVTCP